MAAACRAAMAKRRAKYEIHVVRPRHRRPAPVQNTIPINIVNVAASLEAGGVSKAASVKQRMAWRRPAEAFDG